MLSLPSLVTPLRFHHAVEALQAAAEGFPEGFVAGRVQKRLVVFVYQDGHRLAGLFIGGIDDVIESDAIGFEIIGHVIGFFP